MKQYTVKTTVTREDWTVIIKRIPLYTQGRRGTDRG